MDIKFLQDAIIARDRKSDRMNRNEVISTIADMAESSIKEAERAFNYCIEKGYLKRLRGQGRVRKAQSTTSKRLQVTTASQRRWHNCVSAALDEQLRLNGHDPKFVKLQDHFVGNVDEACIMANEAELYIVGDKKASKSDKNVSDSRFSLTMICSGTAAGTSGPFLFLGSGKNMTCRSLSDENLTKRHGAPPHSSFWLNGNGYMTDKDWIIAAIKLSQGICAMHV
jgi:hypothetical protein